MPGGNGLIRHIFLSSGMPTISYLFEHAPSPLEPLLLPEFETAGLRVWVKRDDLLRMGPGLALCGNKWRKLKYNLATAESIGQEHLLSFGGAFSNHIAAVASTGPAFGFETTGIIRGEAPNGSNPTLRFAAECGMQLHFIDRNTFRQKNEPYFLSKLRQKFGSFYLLPEGGTNPLAINGTREIVKETIQQLPGETPDYWCVSAGTGGTAAGMILEAPSVSKVLTFPALKGNFLTAEINTLIGQELHAQWDLITDYHFGGYARYQPELITFMNQFYERNGIPLDPVYTGKLFFGLTDLAKQGYFPQGSTIVAVHTGGLQGIAGFNERFGHLLHYSG